MWYNPSVSYDANQAYLAKRWPKVKTKNVEADNCGNHDAYMKGRAAGDKIKLTPTEGLAEKKRKQLAG